MNKEVYGVLDTFLGGLYNEDCSSSGSTLGSPYVRV